MNLDSTTKKIVINKSKNLYKWAKIFNRLQMNFFVGQTKLRREKQIEDFVFLNRYTNVKLITDTDVFDKIKNTNTIVETMSAAGIVIITDQKFSRYPCLEIIKKINNILEETKSLYLCLNKHYINIDNSYHDLSLDDNFNLAITQWLMKSLPHLNIVDLSLDLVDYGNYFTWAIPDRHYLITKK